MSVRCRRTGGSRQQPDVRDGSRTGALWLSQRNWRVGARPGRGGRLRAGGGGGGGGVLGNFFWRPLRGEVPPGGPRGAPRGKGAGEGEPKGGKKGNPGTGKQGPGA